MAEHRWSHRHLLSIADLSVEDIDAVLAKADTLFDEARKRPKKSDALRGRTIINLFFESSTRTRSSFEVAGKRLGADVVNISVSTSSVSKGESLLDTVKNLEVMRADALVIRHQASGAPNYVSQHTRASILNAGDGMHEHPTQALLDALTIRRHFGTLSGLTVAICGDIVHSRVARSNAILLGKTGSNVRLCGPKTMMPRHAEELGATTSVHSNLDEAVDGADVVMMLRIQNERVYGPVMASTREYSRTFGLNTRRLEGAKPGAIVMHPGPINRGVELDTRLADGARSVVLEQVEAGVAVRMAALDLCIAANPEIVAS